MALWLIVLATAGEKEPPPPSDADQWCFYNPSEEIPPFYPLHSPELPWMTEEGTLKAAPRVVVRTSFSEAIDVPERATPILSHEPDPIPKKEREDQTLDPSRAEGKEPG